MNEFSGETAAAEQLLAIVRKLAQEAHSGQACKVTLHTSLERDLGLDSLARVELVQRVGKAFGVELPAQALSEADTPRDLLHFLGQSPREEELVASSLLSRAQNTDLPEDARTLVEVLDWHAARQPDAVHILLHDEQHREQPLRHRDLLDDARAVAAGLVARGLRPAQTVALMLPTGRDYLACFFGVMIAGGIPVPIYPPARMVQIEDHLKRHARILLNAEAVLIITIEQAKPVARMLQAAVPGLAAVVAPSELHMTAEPPQHRALSSDVAFIQYTSGSTGDPKGVALTHANLLANIRALGKAGQIVSDDVFVSWLPLYHDMGLIGAWFGSLYHGMPLVLMPPLAFLARPSLWLQMISRHRGTISAAPNFAYELCVRHIGDEALAGIDLSRWRLALNGAEPVSVSTLESFAARFARCGLRRTALTPVYGLAENSVGLAFPPPERGPCIDRIRREMFMREGKAIPATADDASALAIPSCGRPLQGHDIRIVDEAGSEAPERCIGRLEFRGPSATAGYYRNPSASARLFHDGWLDSGDYAYLVNGEVHVTGRIKDLIKHGGRNLYPYDLEAAAGNLPGIRKGCVAVFGSPDPTSGTERLVIMAETRERDDAARARLREALNQTAVDVIGMPADDIVLVPPHSVLKTSSGKIRRLASREAYEQGKAAYAAGVPWLHSARFAANAAMARVKISARRLTALAYGCYAWLLFAPLVLTCGLAVIALHRPPLARRLAHAVARLMFRVAGLPLSAHGIERLPKEPHVLAINHSSYLDAIVLTALLPAAPGYAFAAKREFASQPAMHALLSGLGSLFVERFDATRSMQDVEQITAALKRGENVVVFPEGTFCREAGLRPFHAGAFIAAAKAGAPVVAAGLRGTRDALRDGTWLPRRIAITLEIGEALAPSCDDWSATIRASVAARDAVSTLCGEYVLPD